MPVVLVRAGDLGLAGTESPAELEGNASLRSTVEDLRRQAGPAMGLGDVHDKTVPKVTIVSPPRHGGTVTTRTFIPHRVHNAIGVLGAVSVAAGVLANGTATAPGGLVRTEHPTGTFDVRIALAGSGPQTRVAGSAVVRTARKLSDGLVWPRSGKAT
jgi:4-oxalomesaconate tautomerase